MKVWIGFGVVVAAASFLLAKFFFPMWWDSREERQFLQGVIQAAAKGETEIPLERLTQFVWNKVCFLAPYDETYAPPFPPDEVAAQRALGVSQSLSGFRGANGEEVMVFSTPRGLVGVRMLGWRLEGREMARFAFREYRQKLEGVGYKVDWVSKDKSEGRCFSPGEVLVRVEKE